MTEQHIDKGEVLDDQRTEGKAKAKQIALEFGAN